MTPNPPPEIGFIYRDQYGNQTVLSMTIDAYDSEFGGVFDACKKFMAVIFCEENVEDMIVSKATEMGENDLRLL